ncbi:ICP55 [Scenedesmus sp. PABB004]|nr:ICP55 [Scenedesmus sp. PABB004]
MPLPAGVAALVGAGSRPAGGCLARLGQRWLHARSSGAPDERAGLAGQPTHASHPHLLGPDELAPGLHAGEFAARRRALARLLPPGGVAVLPGAALSFVTGVIPHPYRQDADFLYLTGIQQQAVAVLASDGADGCQFQLFLPPPDPEKERWDGAWLGAAAAVQVFRADEVHGVQELPARVQQLAAGASSVLFDFDRVGAFQYAALRQALHEAIGRGKTMPLRPHLHRLRWVKSPGELALMRSSAAIAAQSMARVMALSHAGVGEGALATEFEYGVRRAGAARLAYPTVAGGGADACTIHYSRNDKQVPGCDLLLMDAGCELHGYVSDVTRTWPVGGRYSDHQRALYDTVRRVRSRCLEAIVPGNTLAKVHQLSVRLLSEGLADLGVLPGSAAADFQAGLYRDFYCHSVGHYLGLDVHDTSTVGPHRALEPGVVLAVEPGLYVPRHPQFGRWAGLGVRIEDDVLVTPAGAEVLSCDVPVDPDEVEALVGAGLGAEARLAAASAHGGAASDAEPAVAVSAA